MRQLSNNLFLNVQVWINGVLVAGSYGFYPVVANIHRLLPANPLQKQGELRNNYITRPKVPEEFIKSYMKASIMGKHASELPIQLKI